MVERKPGLFKIDLFLAPLPLALAELWLGASENNQACMWLPGESLGWQWRAPGTWESWKSQWPGGLIAKIIPEAEPMCVLFPLSLLILPWSLAWSRCSEIFVEWINERCERGEESPRGDNLTYTARGKVGNSPEDLVKSYRKVRKREKEIWYMIPNLAYDKGGISHMWMENTC